MTDEVLAAIAAHGVVPVAAVDDVDQARRLLEALARGGLPVIEVTLRTPSALHALAALASEYGDALVGAGTVRTLADAERVLEAGARFVVSPGTYPELVAACAASGVPAVPGVCTPTEVDAAVRAGASVVKFFPAEAAGGLAMLRALAAPFGDVSFVPTGGIDAGNLSAYLSLPCVAACGGTWLVSQSLLRDGAFDRVEELAREAVRLVAEVRGG